MPCIERGIHAGIMETYRVLEYATSYGFYLQKARRFTDEEKPHYVEEFRDKGFIGLGESIRLDYIHWNDTYVYSIIMRPDDGAFLGCSNKAYILSEDEWNNLLALNEACRVQELADTRRKEQAACAEVIKKCGQQTKLYTKEEAAAIQKQWNDTYNDGGEGFVPKIWTIDDYEKAVRRLAELNAKGGTS